MLMFQIDVEIIIMMIYLLFELMVGNTKEITGDGTNFEALGYGSNIPNYVYVEATEAIPRTTTVYST